MSTASCRLLYGEYRVAQRAVVTSVEQHEVGDRVQIGIARIGAGGEQFSEFPFERTEVGFRDGRTREHLIEPVQDGLLLDLIDFVEGLQRLAMQSEPFPPLLRAVEWLRVLRSTRSG